VGVRVAARAPSGADGQGRGEVRGFAGKSADAHWSPFGCIDSRLSGGGSERGDQLGMLGVVVQAVDGGVRGLIVGAGAPRAVDHDDVDGRGVRRCACAHVASVVGMFFVPLCVRPIYDKGCERWASIFLK